MKSPRALSFRNLPVSTAAAAAVLFAMLPSIGSAVPELASSAVLAKGRN